MTTKEKVNDLLRALDKLKYDFNLSDLEQIISLTKGIEREVDSMEATLKKAA